MAVYADYAATAPLLPEAREALDRVLDAGLGNPSSLHVHGRQARRFLEEARELCARALGARVEEIVFTSGATEADNLALVGTMRLGSPGDRLVISAVEHPAVREAARALELEGYGVDVLPVDCEGRVDPQDLDRVLSPRTRLVSVMAVNNEVGTEQPLAELAARCARAGVPFHSDAVQAPPVRNLRPEALGVQLLSLSGHKLGGLPGAGLLYVRRGRSLAPLLRGGAQEDGRRAGTPNVPALVTLGVALERASREAAGEARRLGALRDRLEGALESVPGAVGLGRGAPRAEHVSAWTLQGLPAEPLLINLDLEGISVSSGSACSSHSVAPSPVLLAMGRSEAESRGLVRFSLGWSTRSEDVERLVEAVPRVVRELRQRSGREVRS